MNTDRKKNCHGSFVPKLYVRAQNHRLIFEIFVKVHRKFSGEIKSCTNFYDYQVPINHNMHITMYATTLTRLK